MATPEELAQLLQYGQQTSQIGMANAQAPRHWAQALAGALQMGIGGQAQRSAAQQEGQGRAEANQMLAQLLSGQGDPQAAMANPYAAAEARQWQAQAPQREMQQFRMAQERQMAPLNMDLKRAQIAAANRKASGQLTASEQPMSVREWKYFSQLPPEQQQQYLSMKRAQQKLDLGTEYQLRTGAPNEQPTTVKKDLVGKGEQEAIGAARGTAMASAPADIASAEDALGLIDQLRNHPGIDLGTGMTSAFNFVPGTQGYAFGQLTEQVKSGAFLTAIQKMRGMGALSNAEGQTATRAVTRLNSGLGKQEFLKALADYEAVIKRGLERAQAMMVRGQQVAPTGQQTSPAPDPAADLKSKYGLE